LASSYLERCNMRQVFSSAGPSVGWLVLALVLGCGDREQKASPKKSKASGNENSLLGSWRVDSFILEPDGKSTSLAKALKQAKGGIPFTGMEFVQKGKTIYLIFVPKKKLPRSPVTLQASASPKILTIRVGKGKVLQGIYDLVDGDTLKICLNTHAVEKDKSHPPKGYYWSRKHMAALLKRSTK
jgi:uncharacterized protein (TIGR03067 family)